MSTALQNKIDFEVIISVDMANPNGDPMTDNRPRQDYNGYGEISPVCIKRKVRNRMQDLGKDIFVQSAERCKDGCASLSERASQIGSLENSDGFVKAACDKYLDVRAFGSLFAYSDLKEIPSVGVRGPVTIRHATSVTPVEIQSLQITKSVNGSKPKNEAARASDTMGTMHVVKYGLYLIKGSINVQLAEKTGFTHEDAEVLRECLRTLFVNDGSAARPEGSMEVVKLYWWEHNCKEGQYPPAVVHRSVEVTQKEAGKNPTCLSDFEIKVKPLDGLEPMVLAGN